MEAGLNFDPAATSTEHHPAHAYRPTASQQLLGKTDDLNRALDLIQNSVHHKIRSKIQQEQDKEERQRAEEV